MSARARLAVAAGAALALAGAFGGSPAPARPPGPVRFERTDLEVGGRITEVLIEDLDGDGRRDLFVVRGREALIFLQEPGGRWAPQPNQRFRFHPATVLFDVGDLDGDGTAEVVLLQKEGVFAYRMRELGGRKLYGLRPTPVIAAASFLNRPVEEEVRRKELLRDLDGDGDLDLILPRGDGFALLANEGQGTFAAPRPLAAPPKAALHLGGDRLSSQLFASYWFPNPNVVQFDGEGPAELVLAREGTLSVFAATAPGALPLAPRGSYTIPDQKQFSRNVEDPLALDFTMPLVLRDLDRDGRVDVASTHVGQGAVRIYKNGADPARAFATPALTVRVKGITFFSYFVDVDGDGRDDLVLPRIDEVGAWSILKALVTRSVPVEMLIYFQRQDGSFPSEPDDRRALDVPLLIRSTDEGLRLGSSIIASVDGDYDGDGRRDLLYRSDDDTIALFRGLPGRRLAKDSAAEVEVPSLDDHRFCFPLVADLDGDGRDDVVLRYWSWNRDADRLTILRAAEAR